MARKIKLTIITEQQYQAGFRAYVKLACPGTGEHDGTRTCNMCSDDFDELITAMHLELQEAIDDSGITATQAIHRDAERLYGWRQERSQAGYCITCGKRKARKGRKTCQPCANAAKERVARARATK